MIKIRREAPFFLFYVAMNKVRRVGYHDDTDYYKAVSLIYFELSFGTINLLMNTLF